MDGPIRWESVEGEEPRHIFGDSGDNANGREFPPGDYIISAMADNDGIKSRPLTKTFTITSSTCPAIAAGPVPAGGRAIWSSTTRAKSGTPYYREFDSSSGTFQDDTTRGANAIFRYTLGQAASSPVCYEQLFVGVAANNKVSGYKVGWF